MAPLPKRRHSTRRQGKRQKINEAVTLPQIIYCKKCKSPKLPHRICPKCHNYE